MRKHELPFKVMQDQQARIEELEREVERLDYLHKNDHSLADQRAKRIEELEREVAEAREKARLQQGMCDRREAEFFAIKTSADSWQKRVEELERENEALKAIGLQGKLCISVQHAELEREVERLSDRVKVLGFQKGAQAIRAEAAEAEVKRLLHDRQMLEDASAIHVRERLAAEAKVRELEADLGACSINAENAVEAYQKRNAEVEAELAAAREQLKMTRSAREILADHRHMLEMHAARKENQTEPLRVEVVSLREQVRVLREALQQIAAGRWNRKTAKSVSASKFAAAALRSSEEPAAKPLQPHPFEPCRSACWCGQPESAHKPAAEEPKR